MKWSSDYTMLTNGATTTNVNTVGDTWVLIDPSVAALERVVERLTRELQREAAPRSYWTLIKDFPTTGQGDEVRAWLMAVCELVSSIPYNTSLWIRLLAAMRLEGVILWPLLQAFLPFPGAPLFSRTQLLRCHSALTAFEQSVVRRCLDSYQQSARCALLALSPVNSSDDVNDEAFCAMLEGAACSWNVYSKGPESSAPAKRTFFESSNKVGPRFLAIFRSLEGLRRSDGSSIRIAEEAEAILRRCNLRRGVTSRWNVYDKLPGARTWIGLFERYRTTLNYKSLTHVDYVFKRWLDFLRTFCELPQPHELTRGVHLSGPAGFHTWLAKNFSPSSSQPGRIVRRVALFSEWAAGEGIPMISFHAIDAPRLAQGRGKSNKAVTPRVVLSEAKSVVRELLEFIYNQDRGTSVPSYHPAFSSPEDEQFSVDEPWKVNDNVAALLPPTLRRPANFEKYIVEVRDEDGTSRRTLNPTLPTLLLKILILPIRSMSARFVSSSEADELTSELAISPVVHGDGKVTHEVDWKWLPNHHPLATKGRRTGVIRSFDDYQGAGSLGFFINSNKTSTSCDRRGETGFDIKWQHPELLDRLNRLERWQRLHNPADKLLARCDLSTRDRKLEVSDGAGERPTTYLFRLFDNLNLSFRQFPPSYTVCRDFFLRVLDEVEARLGERTRISNAAEPDASKHASAPILILTRIGRFPEVGAYSLHSLRVSGITAFAEAGVPPAIIAEFLSGHLTVLMALYYMKFGAATVTRILADAEQAIESGALDDITRNASASPADLLQDLLVSEHGAAFSALEDEIPGFWIWFADGICPNGMTKCMEGGPTPTNPSKGLHGPVEGGARNCPMCRFWLTGPRFVPGQMIMANATLHRMRSLAQGLQNSGSSSLIPRTRAGRTGCKTGSTSSKPRSTSSIEPSMRAPGSSRRVLPWRAARMRMPGRSRDLISSLR